MIGLPCSPPWPLPVAGLAFEVFRSALAPRALTVSFRDSELPDAASLRRLLSWDSHLPLHRSTFRLSTPGRYCSTCLRPLSTTCRGHVPPSRFLSALAAYSKRGPRVCCAPQPILGFTAFWSALGRCPLPPRGGRLSRLCARLPAAKAPFGVFPSSTAAPRHRGRCLLAVTLRSCTLRGLSISHSRPLVREPVASTVTSPVGLLASQPLNAQGAASAHRLSGAVRCPSPGWWTRSRAPAESAACVHEIPPFPFPHRQAGTFQISSVLRVPPDFASPSAAFLAADRQVVGFWCCVSRSRCQDQQRHFIPHDGT